jgi:hypothetical protein
MNVVNLRETNRPTLFPRLSTLRAFRKGAASAPAPHPTFG